MALKKRIKLDINSALKQGKILEVSVLRQLLAVLLNKEKEKFFKEKEEAELTEQEIIKVIFSEVKKIKESIKEFERGQRQDLIDKEKKEKEILENYLPKQLSEEEISRLVSQTIKKVKAREMKDIGKVMAVLVPEIKGRADGSLVSEIVKQELTKNG